MPANGLDKWEIFRELSIELKRNIQLAIVFGENALFVTRNDEVFGFGQNENGCLGTGETLPIAKPKRIPRLCGQKIQDLVHYRLENNNCRIFAISATGSVFAWGDNGHHELGIKTTGKVMLPCRTMMKLDESRIVQVACGEFHTLALTSAGQVYAYGCHNLSSMPQQQSFFPILVADQALASRFVTSIACFLNVCLALLDTGEVCAWVYYSNERKTLRVGSTATPVTIAEAATQTPYLVQSLSGIAISKMVCGKYHALALSFDGNVYFGERFLQANQNDSRRQKIRFTLISSDIGRVTDIATGNNYDEKQPFAALTETNDVYVWDHYDGENAVSPVKKSFTSLDDVFAPRATALRSLETLDRFREDASEKEEEKNNVENAGTLSECVERFLDNRETSDFAFVVEGKKIHVHKLILMMRCAVFKTMFLGDWKERNASEQIIEGKSYTAFYAFLKYFYSDKIDVPPESALELLALAHFYQIPDLLEKCGKFIKNSVTVENAAVIYGDAVRYQAKELNEFVFAFCLENMTSVITSEAFKTLQPQVVRDFLNRAALHGAFKN